MRRAAVLRVGVAASIAIAVMSACLYGVPDVLPIDPDGGTPRIDGSGPRDTNPFPPADGSSGSIDAGCTVCSTPLFEGAGIVTAFTIDDATKRAFIAVKQAAGNVLVEFDPAATAVQTQTIASPPTTVTAIAGRVGTSVVYQAGNEIFRVAPPSPPVPIALVDAGAFNVSALATGVDTSGYVFAVGAQGAGAELRRVAVVDGSNEVLATLPTGTVVHNAIDNGKAVYWFEPSGTMAVLGRITTSNKSVSKSGPQYYPVFTSRNDIPIVATASTFVRLSSSSVVPGTTVGTHTGAPTVLATVEESGMTTTPYWVQGSSNIVRFATTTTASSALGAITIPNGTARVVFLVGLGNRVIIVANTTDRFLVARY